MTKLKDLLKESKYLEREFGEPLPTLNSVMKKHQLQEEVMSDRDIARIKDLTKYNNHTMARYELAKLAKSKQHMKFYQAIMDLQDVIGNLPRGLSLTRHDMEKPFLSLLKRKFKNYDDIYGAL